MHRRTLFTLALLFCWTAGAAISARADDLTSPVPFVGNWTGGAYSDSQTHRFDYCAAGVTYRSGISMEVAVERTYQWRIGFVDPAWNLTTGGDVPLVLTFDGGAPWTVSARVVRRDMAVGDMPDNSALIAAFRGAYTMTVYAGGGTSGFDLTDTSALIPELAECVRSERALEAEGAAPPASGAGAPAASAQPALAATRIASNLLLDARLPDARLLSPAETPRALRGIGAAWKSDAGEGAVMVFPANSAEDPAVVASNLTNGAAQSCKGEFASGRSSVIVDNHLVAKAFSGCKDSEGLTEVRYFVLRGAGGTFVAFFIMGSTAAVPPAGSPLTDAKFQAAIVEATYSP